MLAGVGEPPRFDILVRASRRAIALRRRDRMEVVWEIRLTDQVECFLTVRSGGRILVRHGPD